MPAPTTTIPPLLDRLLLIYSLIFSIILTAGVLFSRPPFPILVTISLFLPVTLTLVIESLKILRMGIRKTDSPTPLESRFKIISPRRHPILFLILALYLLAATGVLAKAITQNPTFVSPLPPNESGQGN
jgi:hypothetical protein